MSLLYRIVLLPRAHYETQVMQDEKVAPEPSPGIYGKGSDEQALCSVPDRCGRVSVRARYALAVNVLGHLLGRMLESAVVPAKAQGQQALIPGKTFKEGHKVAARCGSKAFRNPVSDGVKDETRPDLDIAPGPPFDNDQKPSVRR